MFLLASLALCIAIGWYVPQMLVPRLPRKAAVPVAALAAMGLGAGVVWLGAQAVGVLGLQEAGLAFDRGFNAWKIMIFVAPASALQARRSQAKEVE